jgi:hypothetical protein
MFRKTRKPDPEMRCSFCGKNQDEVAKLIAGPRVFICDDCVRISVGILAGETGHASGRRAIDSDLEAGGKGGAASR